MPFYHKLGNIPHKRHTVFKKPDGGIYYEQLFGTVGFDGMSSLLYHTHRPTMVKDIKSVKDVSPIIAIEKNLKSLSLKGFSVPASDDFLESRVPVLVNNDCHHFTSSSQTINDGLFYKNADCDELVFVHKGQGTLRTIVGNLHFSPGDYLMIPRGMIYAFKFDGQDNRLFIVESTSPMYTPSATEIGLDNYLSIRLTVNEICVAQNV